MKKMLIVVFFQLACPIYPYVLCQEDTDSIIRILRRSFDQKAVIREPALEKIERSRSDFALQVTNDLEKTAESKRISTLANHLNNLLLPRRKIDSKVNGSVHQSSLPRDIASKNASTVRPVICKHSAKIREVLHQQLSKEIEKYCSIGELNRLDKSKENLAKLTSQDATYQAVENICRCFYTVGEISDVFVLERLLRKHDNSSMTLCLTTTIQTIVGFTPETYFNGMCGVGVTKEMLEQMERDKKRVAEEIKSKVLKFLASNRGLDRTKAMKLVAEKEFYRLKTEVNHYQALHFGGSIHPLGFPRYGRKMLEHLEKEYDVKDGGRIQGNYEALRSVVTSEFDDKFVKDIFHEKVKFVGAKLCAIQIITNAGSKKFRQELFELAAYVPAKKKSNQNADYRQDYLVELRQQAAMAIASCHGIDVLNDLKRIKALDTVKTGYFDHLPYIIKEIEGRYSEQN